MATGRVLIGQSNATPRNIAANPAAMDHDARADAADADAKRGEPSPYAVSNAAGWSDAAAAAEARGEVTRGHAGSTRLREGSGVTAAPIDAAWSRRAASTPAELMPKAGQYLVWCLWNNPIAPRSNRHNLRSRCGAAAPPMALQLRTATTLPPNMHLPEFPEFSGSDGALAGAPPIECHRRPPDVLSRFSGGALPLVHRERLGRRRALRR